MKLLIDTSLKTLFLSIIEDDKTVSFFQEEIQKKADALPTVFKDLLNDANIKTKAIKEIYVTTGPGSFMGARTALTFVRTITQITGAQLFVANTLSFISGGVKGTYYIDAKSSKSYRGIVGETTEVSLVDFVADSLVDYSQVIASPKQYLSTFKKVDPIDAFPTYFKDPRIGGE